MWNQLSDIMPKVVVVTAAGYIAAHYFLISPMVAGRVAGVDFIPSFETSYRDVAVRAAERRIAALPRVKPDAVNEIAAAQLHRVQQSLMGDLNRTGLGDLLGINAAMSMAGAQYEQKKQAAIDAYNRAINSIKTETAAELGKSGSVSGCVADAAISETRTEWTIFSASLGLFRPDVIKNFDKKMLSIYRAGRCAGGDSR